MGAEGKYMGRRKTQDGMPHDLAVAVVTTAVATATSTVVKTAIEGIKDRILGKKNTPRHKSKR